MKGVEIGLGFAVASVPGSKAHDEIFFENDEFIRLHEQSRRTGRRNNQRRAHHHKGSCQKPVATIAKPLNSVDLATKEPVKAHVERADICHVPSCGVIAESAVST